MKLTTLSITALAAALTFAPAAIALDKDNRSANQRVERTVTAENNVTVSLCLASGDITVRGWDRREVRARSTNAERMELRRLDNTKDPSPVTRIVVLTSDQADGNRQRPGECQAFSDVELDVPHGAILQLSTRDGNVQVTDVAETHAQTLSGDIHLQRVAKTVEAESISGNVSLKDSAGRVVLHSISGSVEAKDVRPLDANDDFEARSVSGDVFLERVGHTRVEVNTVSGSADMNGPLARGGRYDFKTMSGDVTLVLPPDASFQVSAVVAQGGEIMTDFPLNIAGDSVRSDRPAAPPAVVPPMPAAPPAASVPPAPAAPPAPFPFRKRRLTGTYGSGDATINLASFSGTLHLRRK